MAHQSAAPLSCGLCLEPAPLVLWHEHATACLPCSEEFLANKLDDLRNTGALEALEHCSLAPGCAAPLASATLPPTFSLALRARLIGAEVEARRMRAVIDRAALAGFAGLSLEKAAEISTWRSADPRSNTVCPHCFALTFRDSGCNHSECVRAQRKVPLPVDR